MPDSTSRPASLITRVTLMVGLATTISLIALGFFVQQSIEQHFVEQETEELEIIYEAIQATLNNATQTDKAYSITEELERTVSGHHGVYYLVADSEDNLIYSTPGPDLKGIADNVNVMGAIDSQGLYSWSEDGSFYSGVVLNAAAGNAISATDNQQLFTVVVAAAMDEHNEYLADFYLTLWLVIIGICLFAIFTAWVAARQAHSPIHELSARISNISTAHLDERLDESKVPAELIELVTSFNTMIVRMEEVFEKLSNFSADLAHEFRTPITNIITQTQVSLGKARGVNEYREILYSNLEEYERMAKMVSDMLFLAQTDNGLIKPTFENIDPVNEIEELFEFFEAWAEEKRVSMTLEGACSSVLGDKAMIKRALSNLISNAIDHTPAGHTVVVRLHDESGQTIVDIENSGKEISPQHLPKLFDRFYQADQSRRREGAGLGLAIVKSIIELHNGEVSVKSLNGITSFQLSIPISTEIDH